MPDTGQDAGVAKMKSYHLTNSRIPYCGGGERQSMVILGQRLSQGAMKAHKRGHLTHLGIDQEYTHGGGVS